MIVRDRTNENARTCLNNRLQTFAFALGVLLLILTASCRCPTIIHDFPSKGESGIDPEFSTWDMVRPRWTGSDNATSVLLNLVEGHTTSCYRRFAAVLRETYIEGGDYISVLVYDSHGYITAVSIVQSPSSRWSLVYSPIQRERGGRSKIFNIGIDTDSVASVWRLLELAGWRNWSSCTDHGSDRSVYPGSVYFRIKRGEKYVFYFATGEQGDAYAELMKAITSLAEKWKTATVGSGSLTGEEEGPAFPSSPGTQVFPSTMTPYAVPKDGDGNKLQQLTPPTGVSVGTRP